MKPATNLLKRPLLGLAYVALLIGPGIASADNLWNWTYIGSYNGGANTIVASGQVSELGGLLTGGSGTLTSAPYYVGQTLSLVFPSNPGAVTGCCGANGFELPQTGGWQGDINWGPSGYGPLFQIGSATSPNGGPAQVFGFWSSLAGPGNAWPDGSGTGAGFSFGDGAGSYQVATSGSLTLTAVPLPASAWLLLSGLLGLIVFGRKRASLFGRDSFSHSLA